MPNQYVSTNSEFYKTYLLYRNYVGYEEPLTWRQWMRLDDRLKVGALYCQFFDEITLAWWKTSRYSPWAIEEEGVETINQYLTKNVEKIKNDKKRFKAPYIYTVAYNCLYCINIDPSKNKDRYYTETSETYQTGDDECSWFDLLGNAFDVEEEKDHLRESEVFNRASEPCQIYIDFASGVFTKNQTFRKLKAIGYASGSSRNKLYVDSVLAILEGEVIDELRNLYSQKDNFEITILEV